MIDLRNLSVAQLEEMGPMALVDLHIRIHNLFDHTPNDMLGSEVFLTHAWIANELHVRGLLHPYLSDLDHGVATDDPQLEKSWSREAMAYTWFTDSAMSWDVVKDLLGDDLGDAPGKPWAHWRTWWTRKAMLGHHIPGDLPAAVRPLDKVPMSVLQEWQMDWARAAVGLSKALELATVEADRHKVLKAMAAYGVSPDSVLGLEESLVAWSAGVETEGPDSFDLQILKRRVAGDQQLATGPVLIPDIVDGQGDIISAEAIERTSHLFVRKYNRATKLGVQHKVFGVGIDLVESWILKEDWKISKERTLPKGTWMMTVHVRDDKLWKAIKVGELTGFSVGGKGLGVRLQQAA